MVKGSLIVVGLGIQWAGQTTQAARRAIESADQVLYAVADPWAARWLHSLNASAQPLPYPADATRRRDIYADMVARILGAVRWGARVCAAFYGDPSMLTTAAHRAVHTARQEGYAARMLPGVSSLACLFADLGVDPGRRGCRMYEATDFVTRARPADVHTDLVLFQIGLIGNLAVFDPAREQRIETGLATLSTVLCTDYPDDHEVVVYEAASHPIASPRIEHVAVGALARVAASEISTLYVPAVAIAPIARPLESRPGAATSSRGAGETTTIP